jgi:hypothetical protein
MYLQAACSHTKEALNLCMQVRLPAYCHDQSVELASYHEHADCFFGSKMMSWLVQCCVSCDFPSVCSSPCCLSVYFCSSSGENKSPMYGSCLLLICWCWIRLVFTEHDQYVANDTWYGHTETPLIKPSPFGCFAPVVPFPCEKPLGHRSSEQSVFERVIRDTWGLTFQETDSNFVFLREMLLRKM